MGHHRPFESERKGNDIIIRGEGKPVGSRSALPENRGCMGLNVEFLYFGSGRCLLREPASDELSS